MATNIPVSVEAFRLLCGQDLIRSFESSPGKKRCFCGHCGSPLYSKRDSIPGVLRIRAGLLDGPLQTRVQAHFYTASLPNWWSIRDDLPQYASAQDLPKP